MIPVANTSFFILLLGIALSCCFFLSLIFISIKSENQLDISLGSYSLHIAKEQKPSLKKTYNIAILLPDDIPSVMQQRDAFVKTLQSKSNSTFLIKDYNAHGHVLNLDSYIQEIQLNTFDLVFVIGSHCMQMIKDEVSFSWQDPITPILFSCIQNPITQDLIKPTSKAHQHMTGVAQIGHDYNVQITLFLTLFPNVKKFILLYDPIYVEKDYLDAHAILTNNHIEIVTVAIKNRQSLSLLHPHLPTTDVLMCFRDFTTMSLMKEIVALGIQYKTAILASDLGSVSLGAAAGFGARHDTLGEECAYYAHLILEKKLGPAQMPIRFLHSPQKLLLNLSAIQQQGLSANPQLLSLVGATKIWKKKPNNVHSS